MATLTVMLATGDDDLRDSSSLNFGVNLRSSGLRIFQNIVAGHPNFGPGLGAHTTVFIPIPDDRLNDPNDVFNFTLEQISQEPFGQTRDNWDMSNIQVILNVGNFPLILAQGFSHRFDGNTPTIAFIGNQILH